MLAGDASAPVKTGMPLSLCSSKPERALQQVSADTPCVSGTTAPRHQRLDKPQRWRFAPRRATVFRRAVRRRAGMAIRRRFTPAAAGRPYGLFVPGYMQAVRQAVRHLRSRRRLRRIAMPPTRFRGRLPSWRSCDKAACVPRRRRRRACRGRFGLQDLAGAADGRLRPAHDYRSPGSCNFPR